MHACRGARILGISHPAVCLRRHPCVFWATFPFSATLHPLWPGSSTFFVVSWVLGFTLRAFAPRFHSLIVNLSNHAYVLTCVLAPSFACVRVYIVWIICSQRFSCFVSLLKFTLALGFIIKSFDFCVFSNVADSPLCIQMSTLAKTTAISRLSF